MTDPPAASAIERGLVIALEENQLPSEYAQSVRELIEQPEADWPQCCGSDCDPCILALQRAAARAKQIAAKIERGE